MKAEHPPRRNLVHPSRTVALLLALWPSFCAAATFNVKNYGTIGDGITDDTSAIRNCINAADDAAGTNTVYFPAGVYLVNNLPLTPAGLGTALADLTFEGDNANVSIIKRWPMGYPDDNRIATIDGGARNLTFRNLGFDANGLNKFGGIACYNSSNITVQHVHCFDSNSKGVTGYDKWMFWFNGGSSISLLDNLWEDLQIEVDRCSHVQILRNVVKRPRETGGIGLWAVDSGYAADDYLIQDNWIIDPSRVTAGAIVVQLDKPTNSNCSFTNIRILNNTVVYSNPAAYSRRAPAIKLGTGDMSQTNSGDIFNYITLQGNRFYVDSALSGFTRNFIFFCGTTPTVCFRFDNTNVTNNTLFYNGTKGILETTSGCKGVNWVESNNLKSAYVPPPAEPNPLLAAGPILEYLFNETGTTASSSGNVSIPLTLYNSLGAPSDLHTSAGGGVSGLSGDRALDLSSAVGMGTGYTGPYARHASDDDSIDTLKSFTVTCWFKTAGTTKLTSYAQLVHTQAAADGPGFNLFGSSVPGVAQLNVDGAGSTSPSAVYGTTGSWVFIAATYDGTLTTGNVRWYIGTSSSAVSSAGTSTLNRAATDSDVAALIIGNRLNGTSPDRPFDGYIDNVRIYGSKMDASGVLTQSQLETLRQLDK